MSSSGFGVQDSGGFLGFVISWGVGGFQGFGEIEFGFKFISKPPSSATRIWIKGAAFVEHSFLVIRALFELHLP